MSEFGARLSAQRRVIATVNARPWREELFGLSSKAIDRWASANAIGATSNSVKLLRAISDILLSLANRSQEQITDDYTASAAQVVPLTEELTAELNAN